MSRLTDEQLRTEYAKAASNSSDKNDHTNALRAVADAAVAAYVPEGYALVPIEPTREMREAFNEAQEEWEDGGWF